MKNSQNVYHIVPEPVTGYLLDPKKGYFSVIVPEERRNYCTNPSFETNDDHVTTLGGAVAARSTTRARRGVYSIRVTPGGTSASAFIYDVVSNLGTTLYWWSFDIWANAGHQFEIYSPTTAHRHYKYTGTGRWDRVTISDIEPTVGNDLVIKEVIDGRTDPFYIDGLQLEFGDYPTTYIDGDQVGYKSGFLDYYWLGTAHDSYSVRTGNCRAGGRVVPLKDLGFEVLNVIGLGIPPLEHDFMPYGILDGSEYHDTHVPSRQFTITGAMFGKQRGQLQKARKNLIDTIKPDLVLPRQPVVLRYEFNRDCEEEGIVLDIPSVYIEGMGGQFDNHHQERIALTFQAPNPFLLDEGNTSAFLDDLDAELAMSWAFRDVNGLWTDYGDVEFLANPGFILEMIQSKYRGGLWIAGQFDTFNTHACDRLAYMDLGTRAVTYFFPFANGDIWALEETPNGNLYIGGEFSAIGGSGRRRICYMDSSNVTHTLDGNDSGTNGPVYTIAASYNGDVFFGGDFTQIVSYSGGGSYTINRHNIGMYDVSTNLFSSISPLSDPDGSVFTLIFGVDEKLYACGNFTTMNGVTVNHVAVYNPSDGTWEALGNGLTGGTVYDIRFGPDGRLYAVGTFTSPCKYAAVFNGANWEQLGSGIQDTTIGTTRIFTIRQGPDGIMYLAGDFAIQGPLGKYDCEYATWNGSTFGYLDAQPPAEPGGVGACDGYMICITNANEIALSFDYSTALPGQFFFCGQTQTVNNPGSAIVHPTIVCSISGGQYDYLYIRNVTTGDEIRFDLKMFDGGRFWVDTTPGKIRAWSNYRPVEKILFDGSDLATFKLLPGDNIISVYSNRSSAATAEVGMYWKNNYWSIDSGVA